MIIIILIFIITICIIFYLFKKYEKFESGKPNIYKPKLIGPIIFYDYNYNKIATYPDDTFATDLFKKKEGKYINLKGAGEPLEIVFPKAKKGENGPKGYIGIQGNTGKKGINGENVIGPIGPRGEEGIKGPMGPKGVCNICDSRGAQGALGREGSRGIQGLQGPKGIQPLKTDAPKGLPGPRGRQGSKGLIGKRGQVGPEGKKGAQGEKGIAIEEIGNKGSVNPNIVDSYLMINHPKGANIPENVIIGNPDNDINIDNGEVYIINDLCIHRDSSESCNDADQQNGACPCINKGDIRRLYNLNNPTCTCPGGVASTGSDCKFNGISCESCYANKYLIDETYDSFMGIKNSNKCNNCDTFPCPDGKYRTFCGYGSQGTCRPYTCSCDNGTAASGAECNTNNEKCVSCNNGYYLDEETDTCKPCVNCGDCGPGTFKSGCDCNSGAICESCPTNTWKEGTNSDNSCLPDASKKTCDRNEYWVHGGRESDAKCYLCDNYRWNPYNNHKRESCVTSIECENPEDTKDLLDKGRDIDSAYSTQGILIAGAGKAFDEVNYRCYDKKRDNCYLGWQSFTQKAFTTEIDTIETTDGLKTPWGWFGGWIRTTSQEKDFYKNNAKKDCCSKDIWEIQDRSGAYLWGCKSSI